MMAAAHRSIDLRLQYLAEQLHRLGPRAIYELFVELRSDPTGDLVGRLERYAAIDPAHLYVTGGDRFPSQMFEVAR